jgi:hypothetical protein
MFMNLSEKFNMMYKRKAFTKWYFGEGMDEMEFVDSMTNLEKLTTLYSSSQ